MRRFYHLCPGDTGPMTELLQLGLARAGLDVGVSGVFDRDTASALREFQSRHCIDETGVADAKTRRALMPYLTGYRRVTAEKGDTLKKLADRYGADPAALRTANPALCNRQPAAGQRVTVPLLFDVVPDNVSFTSLALSLCAAGLRARYPFLETGSVGKSVMGRPIRLFRLGRGVTQVLYNGAHHANEWITSPLLMRFLEKYAAAVAAGGKIFDNDALSLYSEITLNMVPMVNPDGVDLVTGYLSHGPWYDRAAALAENAPEIAFPSGWKANINGVDLNLQYPAGWENAAAIKAALGVCGPGPRDYAGPSPLSEPESWAMYEYTRRQDFALTLSYHTQGRVIYWKYLDFEPKNSYDIALKFADVSGYDAEETPSVSGYAGYKDWFISCFDRPGYTVEAGEGVSPLPLSQLGRIYEENVGILTLGLKVMTEK